MKNCNESVNVRRELIFRVFVSSTFSDFIAERNELQSKAFPEIEKYCQDRNARFQAVDLRWGISSEAAYNQKTMSICLAELKRCRGLSPRPNFLVLLGQRYGWIPLRERIPAEELNKILAVLPEESRELVCSDQEIPVWSRLNRPQRKGWYRYDNNADPSEYVLQPRRIKEIDCTTDSQREALRNEEKEDWFNIESKILTLFKGALVSLGWDQTRCEPYEQSATHQEISAGALAIDDADQHVLMYYRVLNNLSGKVKHTFIDPNQDGLSILKSELENRVHFENRETFTACLDPQMSTASREYLDRFCIRVKQDLIRLIDAEIKAFAHHSAEEMERQGHIDFGAERCRHFQGRTGELHAIETYLKADDSAPLILCGESGSGKTALMAEAVRRYSPDAVVRYIGATPASGSLYGLLSGLCSSLEISSPPENIKELTAVFRDRLSNSCLGPVALFIDGLDQLRPDDYAHSLFWLPRQLGPGVKVVVSVLHAAGAAGAAQIDAKRLWSESILELGTLAQTDAETLLTEWLGDKDVKRALTKEQRDHILSRFRENGTPLFLKVAFEEVRLWHHWDGLPCGADHIPGLNGTVSGVLEDMLCRLESGAYHGRELVEYALSALAVSKSGLAEDELLQLLSVDYSKRNPESPKVGQLSVVMDAYRERNPESPEVSRLPVVIWSRLWADLAPYLVEARVDEIVVIRFYHRQIEEAVYRRYLRDDASRKRIHSQLLGLYLVADQQKLLSGRSAKAIAYHAWRCQSSAQLEKTILRPELIQAWAGCGYIHDLPQDLPSFPGISDSLSEFLNCWERNTAWISRFPNHAGQIIHNCLPSTESSGRLKTALDSYLRNISGSGFCLAENRCTPAVSTDWNEHNLFGMPLQGAPFHGRHLFFSSDSLLGIMSLEFGTTELLKIPNAGVTRAGCSPSEEQIFVEYRMRRPHWVLFDRSGRTITDAGQMPCVSSVALKAFMFAAEGRLLLVENDRLRIVRISDMSIEAEHVFRDEEVQLADCTMCNETPVVAVCLRGGTRLRFATLCAEPSDTAWNIVPCAEALLDGPVSHLRCSAAMAVAVSVDHFVHLLPACGHSFVGKKTFLVPKRAITSVACNDKSLFFFCHNTPVIYRIDAKDGRQMESGLIKENIVDLQVTDDRLYALTRSQLISQDSSDFQTGRSPEHRQSPHDVRPVPIQRRSTSLSGRTNLLTGGASSAAVMDEFGALRWITPSHSWVIDTAAGDGGNFCTLNADGDIYVFKDLDCIGHFENSGCRHIFLLKNTVVFCQWLTSGQWELFFRNFDGHLLGSWTNRFGNTHASLRVRDFAPSSEQRLRVLLSGECEQPFLTCLELDIKGQIQNTLAIEPVLPNANLHLDRRWLVEWSRSEIAVRDLNNTDRESLRVQSPRLGAFYKARILRTPDQEWAVVHGEYGVLLFAPSSGDNQLMLPGIKPASELFALRFKGLCVMPSCLHQDFYTIT